MPPSRQFGTGRVLSCFENGVPQADPTIFDIRLVDYWKQFFTSDHPEEYEFMPGGHFCISKEHAHARSKDFYKSVVLSLESDPQSPWNIERLECYMFNPNYKTIL